MAEEIIRFRCPHCHQTLKVSASKAGRSFACPACKESITVPDADISPIGVKMVDRRPTPSSQTSDASAKSSTTAEEKESYRSEDQPWLQGGNRRASAGKKTDRATSSAGLNSGEEKWINFLCRYCGTTIRAFESEAGSKKPCPSCQREIQVPYPIQEEKPVVASSSNEDSGSYDLQPEPVKEETPKETTKQKIAEPVIVGSRAEILPMDAPPEDEPIEPPAQPSAPVSKAKSKTKKKTSTGMPSEEELREYAQRGMGSEIEPLPSEQTTKSEKKKERGWEPGGYNGMKASLDDRGNVVLTIRNPPKRTMGWHLFVPLNSLHLWAHWLFSSFLVVGIVLIITYWIFPLIAQKNLETGSLTLLKVQIAAARIICIFLGLFAVRGFALNLFSAVDAFSEGHKTILEWHDEGIVDSIFLVLRMLAVDAVALIPGVPLFFLLPHSGSYAAAYIAAVTAGTISFLLFFPIVLLSTLQTNFPVMPVTSLVFDTVLRRPLTWLFFYIWSFGLFGLPVILSTHYLRGVHGLVAALFLTMIIPPLYSVLIGRLSWVVADSIRS